MSLNDPKLAHPGIFRKDLRMDPETGERPVHLQRALRSDPAGRTGTLCARALDRAGPGIPGGTAPEVHDGPGTRKVDRWAIEVRPSAVARHASGAVGALAMTGPGR